MARVDAPEATAKSTPLSRSMSEAEFLAWRDEDIKAEWVEGEVIIMSPASAKHVRLAGFISQIMGTFARQRRLGEVLGPELQIHLAQARRWRVPDLLFVAAERLEMIKVTHVEGAPDLIVEIVSPDSQARDWREKYLEYEAAGVREYWIIDPMSERVEAYGLNPEMKYELIPVTAEALHSTVVEGFYLKPAWLWQEPLPDPLEILRELRVL